jgi:hypothetical protein
VVVLPSATGLQLEELEGYGLTVVHAAAEEFTTRLRAACSEGLERLRNAYGTAVSSHAATFLQQFVDLRAYQPRQLDTAREFYQGYKPGWEVILNDDDVEFETTRDAANLIVDEIRSTEVRQRVVVIHGEAGTGKSTALLRIAKTAMGAGARPFIFRGDENLDVDAALLWVQSVPGSILLFDDSADFAGALEQLAEACSSRNARLVAAITERTSRLRLVNDRISSSFLVPDPAYRLGRLSDDDISMLLAKLHSRGRLGRITRLRRTQQLEYFRSTARRRLFDAMADLEGGQGFKQTVRRGFDEITDDRIQTLYGASSMAYQWGLTLPVGPAATISGLSVRDLVSALSPRSAEAILLTRAGVRPPHRVTASIVINDVLTSDQRFQVSLLLAKAVAPHLDIHAIRRLTANYRIARQLLDQDTVVAHVGTSRAREWYDELRDDYSWNGRYWEQRALLESRFGDHRTARSYAERALQVHSHPYAYNTLGTVLLRTACEQGSVAFLREGIDQLEQARHYRSPWIESEHPYVTFFTSLLRFAREWGLQAIPDDVRSKWRLWHRDALASTLFSHEDRFAEVQGWQREWLMLATNGSS